MREPSITPPTPRQALIARGEQAAIVLLAIALVVGIAWRAISYGRVGSEPIAVTPAEETSYRVNVNTADWTTLALVPGLGKALSERIVAARDARPGQRFTSLEQLKDVRGISDKTLAKLRPYLTLGDAGGDEPVEMVEPPRPAP